MHTINLGLHRNMCNTRVEIRSDGCLSLFGGYLFDHLSAAIFIDIAVSWNDHELTVVEAR